MPYIIRHEIYWIILDLSVELRSYFFFTEFVKKADKIIFIDLRWRSIIIAESTYINLEMSKFCLVLCNSSHCGHVLILVFSLFTSFFFFFAESKKGFEWWMTWLSNFLSGIESIVNQWNLWFLYKHLSSFNINVFHYLSTSKIKIITHNVINFFNIRATAATNYVGQKLIKMLCKARNVLPNESCNWRLLNNLIKIFI